MKHIIVGTAGHIDHGKTALIEAMNGYNGDELKEEKEKGITIDLSFSNITDKNTNIAFIDVPGHEKLVKNMISGAFGFDICLFVVDVNEGLMPQSIEHLEVLSFLGVKDIIIALSKCDLSTDTLIANREKEILDFLKNYPNINLVKIFRTSIHDQKSIDNLKEYLFTLKGKDETKENEIFRYYIDRVFSVKGFGEVVTGTVLSGFVEKNQKIYVCELAKEIVVKNIQVHKESRNIATKHQRVALNLDITHGKLKKGYLLSNKGYLRGFNTIDIFIETIDKHTISNNQNVNFLYGTKNLSAKINLYSDKKINGGYYAKATLNEKAYLLHRDKFILLLNNWVVGGGIVLDPISDPIKKSKKLPILRHLYNKEYKEAFLEFCQNHKKGFGLISSLQRFALNHEKALSIAKELDNIFIDEKALVLYPKATQDIIKNKINEIYTKNSYALLSPTALKLRIKWASEDFIKECLDYFVSNGFLEIEKNIYKRKDIGKVDIDKELEKRVVSILENSGFTPPAPYNLYDDLDIDRKLGDQIFKKLTSSKKIVRIAHNLFITAANLSKILSMQKEIIKKDGYIDIKNFRQRLNLSRKYLIGYLEYLDKLSEIKKEGNRRYLIG